MIYETKGKAREYFELAANLYISCEHGCIYCYAPDVLHIGRDEFYRRSLPKQNGELALSNLRKDAQKLALLGERDRHILLSFISDPYQPIESKLKLTRRAIEILHGYGLKVAILTKGGKRAERDFNMLNQDDLFGVTLTFITSSRSLAWEPGAALPEERIASLKAAHEKGIPTFVSLEPVIDPMETFQIIELTAPYVDHYKVGKLNYEEKLPRDFEWPRVDWRNFAVNMQIMLNKLGKSYYLKKDLTQYIGNQDGLTVGNVPK